MCIINIINIIISYTGREEVGLASAESRVLRLDQGTAAKSRVEKNE